MAQPRRDIFFDERFVEPICLVTVCFWAPRPGPREPGLGPGPALGRTGGPLPPREKPFRYICFLFQKRKNMYLNGIAGHRPRRPRPPRDSPPGSAQGRGPGLRPTEAAPDRGPRVTVVAWPRGPRRPPQTGSSLSRPEAPGPAPGPRASGPGPRALTQGPWPGRPSAGPPARSSPRIDLGAPGPRPSLGKIHWV